MPTESSTTTDKVKVAIRVRPLNRREIDLKTKCVVEVKCDQTILHYVHQPTTTTSSSQNNTTSPSTAANNVAGKKSGTLDASASGIATSNSTGGGGAGTYRTPKIFTFDHCFWSFDSTDSHYADQEEVFRKLGLSVLDSAFQGYNACIFAYGQTGSGKSYTMMGTSREKGLIPRLCDAIFERIGVETDQDSSSNFKLEVSYMEIYNEKVHDLLSPHGTRHNLKVREHNILGPYVDGLSTLAVSSFEEIDSLMAEGNKSRTVAATNMNSESSRSHAVFTLTLTCSVYDEMADVRGERVSKMSLVDLAGSERAIKTGAFGERLKEGSNINKSLTTLGLVISKLADQASGKNKKEQFVPYRDSVLTWLLKDNLGGNSKTIMISTISPAADSYEETLSTLRYADRAKRIVNHAVINEDPNNRIIRELREEVEQLREQLMHATVQTGLQERLVESEKLIREMEQTWEEKLRKTEKIHQERQQTLERMGISVQSSGIAVEKDRYYLINLNADPSMNALLVYYLKDERTLIGRPDGPTEQDIKLSGVGIQPEHAIIEIDRERNQLWMKPINGARTYVNGQQIFDQVQLCNGDRILWGNNHFFSLNCPINQNQQQQKNMMDLSCTNLDYNFARDEMLSFNNPDLEATMFALQEKFEDPSRGSGNNRLSLNAFDHHHHHHHHPLSGSATFLPAMQNKFGGSQNGRLGGSSMNLSLMSNSSSASSSAMYMRIMNEKLAQEREEHFKVYLAKLREEIAKANTLAHEANLIAEEMRKNTEFKVTLQIPATNLSPNRSRRGLFVSEPAILVKRKQCPSQIWSMEKFDSNLIEMRELYGEWKERQQAKKDRALQTQSSISSVSTSSSIDESPSSPRIQQQNDPFYEFQERHLLIGVANIYLEVLMQDVMLDYQVPIITQQGEMAGRLHIEFGRIEGDFELDRIADAAASDADTQCSDDTNSESGFEPNTSNSTQQATNNSKLGSNQIRIRLVIKSAYGLPPELSNFVFCQYSIYGYSDGIVVTPTMESTRLLTPNLLSSNLDRLSPSSQIGAEQIAFNHQREFIITLTEEFRELCSDGALSIEIWGHRISANAQNINLVRNEWGVVEEQMKISRSLTDRWLELKRRLELWVEIHELNDQGEYQPVEVQFDSDVYTGGVYQLRQGQQRRISVRISKVANSGTLPFAWETIRAIEIGCVNVRSRTLKSLDSYQEDDLNLLREKWNAILQKRQGYLQEQINELINKSKKTQEELDRENRLMNQWVSLVEERKTLRCPNSGSGIPGAPDDQWQPPVGMEGHVPVLFFDLNTHDLNMSNMRLLEVCGKDSILPKEHNGSPFFNLQVASCLSTMENVQATAVWDSSVHESPHLNRTTAPNERIFLILKVFVRLSHPAPMDLVLRKRIAINVYKKQSFVSSTKNIFKRISRAEMASFGTGITYEVASSIPKASEDAEDRESLALLAAADVDLTACDGESYIERYTKSISALESLLTLDRLRQEVAVREQIAKKAKHALKSMTSINGGQQVASPGSKLYCQGNESLLRKTLSVPNIASIAPFGPHKPNVSANQTLRPVLIDIDLDHDGMSSSSLSVKADSSLSYFTSAADRLRQKASSIFGSMTGLNQISQQAAADEQHPQQSTTDFKTKNDVITNRNNRNELQTINNNLVGIIAITTATGNSVPSSTTSTSLSNKQRNKPVMLPLMEEQNSIDDDSTKHFNMASISPNQKTFYSSLLNHRSMNEDQTNSDSDTEDQCYIVYESPRKPRLNNLLNSRAIDFSEDDEIVDHLVKQTSESITNNLRVDTVTPTSFSSSSGCNSIMTSINGSTGVINSSSTPISNESSSLSIPSSSNGSSDEDDSSNLLINRYPSIEKKSSKSNLPEWMQIGESVRISPDSKLGVISYIGRVDFASDTWVGVVLDSPTGKNDGSVNGIQYFECKPKFGIFVKPDKLKLDPKGRIIRQQRTVTPIKVNGKK